MKCSWLAVIILLTSSLAADNGLPQKYKKWVNEDVVYIISDPERSEFLRLSADVERDAFIERFWKIRDTDSSTEENEFRIEHYSRIKYANDRLGKAALDGKRSADASGSCTGRPTTFIMSMAAVRWK